MKIDCINHIIEVNKGPQNYNNLFQLVSASQHILFCHNKMLVFTNIFLVVSSMYLTWDIYIGKEKGDRDIFNDLLLVSFIYLFIIIIIYD